MNMQCRYFSCVTYELPFQAYGIDSSSGLPGDRDECAETSCVSDECPLQDHLLNKPVIST